VEEYLFDSLCLICLIIEEIVEKWSLRLLLLSKFNLFKKRLSNTLFWGKVSSGFDHSSDGFGIILYWIRNLGSSTVAFGIE